MPYKKLIETAMPVSVINTESEKEKTARNGVPANVHIWWSRRPMAAARSVLFASLIDDPSQHPERFRTQGEQIDERNRLLQMTSDLANVENTWNSELLEKAKEEISRYVEGAGSTVFDPFAGGGAIPVEAHRLGLDAIAADLNPVAALITMAVSDIPNRFTDSVPIHPSETIAMDIPLPTAKRLAEDVQWYGDWMLGKAKDLVGSLYPTLVEPESQKEIPVSAWIWARTVKCPNPSCGCNIPLSSSYDLAKKKGSEAWVEPFVESGAVRFRIHREQHPIEKGKPKVAQTAVFKCPACGEITPDAYVKECGFSRQIGSQLIAVVADHEKKRYYIEPDLSQLASAATHPPKSIPHGKLPNNPRRFSPVSFGVTDYADLFTNRQLSFLTTMIELTKEVQAEAETQAIKIGFADDGISFARGGNGARAYAEAIRIILMLTISKLLDRCSNLCSWDSSGGGSLRNVFSRAAMPMIWDFAEANPFGDASGSFSSALARTCETIANLPTGNNGKTEVADCAVPNKVRDAIISTELPYYDRTGYADLSDFFYVWLKYGLEDIFPEWFKTDLTPKNEELTAFSYRYNGDKSRADAIYQEGIKLSLANLFESASDDYPSTLSFIYKGNDVGDSIEYTEWETFVSAICDAGFEITASWPLARKYESSIELAESRGIPITVVVRKKRRDAQQITRRIFVATVKREVPAIIERLKECVSLMDLRSSVIGQALNIYSRYRNVLDADGSNMKPQMASRIIEQEIDTILTSLYEDGAKESFNEED